MTPPSIRRIPPGPGQESVWDYPRPPALERTPYRLRVVFGGAEIADTSAGYRVLETSHPPTYYLPLDCFAPGTLLPNAQRSLCEWKGAAVYFDVISGGRRAEGAAWTYPDPTARFDPIRDHVAVYAHMMDACYVGDEQVDAQEGGFYGGWVTSHIVGPFKGPPGTRGW